MSKGKDKNRIGLLPITRSLNFREYQNKARGTAIYPKLSFLSDKSGQEIQVLKARGLFYTVLGLCGEAGEIANFVKKIYRDRGGKITEKDREHLSKELGDCLWYLSQCCTELGLSLDTIAQLNLEKLQDRKERDKIEGDGDNR